MTNLLIAYPEIPSKAIASTSYAVSDTNSPNELEFAPARNLWTLRRSHNWIGAYDLGDHYVEWDLGVDGELSADFVSFARIDRLCNLAATVGYYLDARNDVLDPWTTIDHYGYPEDTNGVNSLTKLGTRGTDDYISIFTASSAYRYWRIHLDSINGSNFVPRLSKCFFGSILDLSQEPNSFSFEPTFRRSGSLRTSSDAIRIVRASSPQLQIEVIWEWVADDKLELFYDRIVENRDRYSLMLYTQSFHSPLRDLRLLHCRLIHDSVISKKGNLNQLRCKFEEVIG